MGRGYYTLGTCMGTLGSCMGILGILQGQLVNPAQSLFAQIRDVTVLQGEKGCLHPSPTL